MRVNGWEQAVTYYFVLVCETLEQWAITSSKILQNFLYHAHFYRFRTSKYSATFLKFQIQRINAAATDLRQTFLTLRAVFQDLSNEFCLKSVELNDFRRVIKAIERSLDRVLRMLNYIGRSYGTLFQRFTTDELSRGVIEPHVRLCARALINLEAEELLDEILCL